MQGSIPWSGTMALKDFPMEEYEIWMSKDGGEWTLLPKNSPSYELLTKDVDGNDMKKMGEFAAATWEDAKLVHNEFVDLYRHDHSITMRDVFIGKRKRS